MKQSKKKKNKKKKQKKKQRHGSDPVIRLVDEAPAAFGEAEDNPNRAADNAHSDSRSSLIGVVQKQRNQNNNKHTSKQKHGSDTSMHSNPSAEKAPAKGNHNRADNADQPSMSTKPSAVPALDSDSRSLVPKYSKQRNQKNKQQKHGSGTSMHSNPSAESSSGLSSSSGRREAYVKAKGAGSEKQVRDVMKRSNEMNKKEAEDNPNRVADNAHSDSGSPLIGGVRKQQNEKNKKQKHRSDASKPEEKRSERSVGTLVEKVPAKGNHNRADNADQLSMSTKPSAVPTLDSDSRSLVPKYSKQRNQKNKQQKHGSGTSTHSNPSAESSSGLSSSSGRREAYVKAKGAGREKQVKDVMKQSNERNKEAEDNPNRAADNAHSDSGSPLIGGVRKQRNEKNKKQKHRSDDSTPEEKRWERSVGTLVEKAPAKGNHNRADNADQPSMSTKPSAVTALDSDSRSLVPKYSKQRNQKNKQQKHGSGTSTHSNPSAESSSGLSSSSGRREAYVKAKGAGREKQVRDVMKQSNERNKKVAEDNPNRAADNAHSDSGSPLIGGVRKQRNEKNKKQKHRSDASTPEEKRWERSVGTLVEKAPAKGNHNRADNANQPSMSTKPSAVLALDSDSRSLVPKYSKQRNQKNKEQKHGSGTSTHSNPSAESSSGLSSSSGRREAYVKAKGAGREKQVRDVMKQSNERNKKEAEDNPNRAADNAHLDSGSPLMGGVRKQHNMKNKKQKRRSDALKPEEKRWERSVGTLVEKALAEGNHNRADNADQPSMSTKPSAVPTLDSDSRSLVPKYSKQRNQKNKQQKHGSGTSTHSNPSAESSSGLSSSSGRREAYVKAKGAGREKQVKDVMKQSNERNNKEAEDNPNRATDNAHLDSGSPLIGGVRKQRNEKNKKQKHRSDASKPEEKRWERSVGTLVEKAPAKGNHNRADNADQPSMSTKPSAVPTLDSDSRSLVPKYSKQRNQKNKQQKHGSGTSTHSNPSAESSSGLSSSSGRREAYVKAKGAGREKQVRDVMKQSNERNKEAEDNPNRAVDNAHSDSGSPLMGGVRKQHNMKNKKQKRRSNASKPEEKRWERSVGTLFEKAPAKGNHNRADNADQPSMSTKPSAVPALDSDSRSLVPKYSKQRNQKNKQRNQKNKEQKHGSGTSTHSNPSAESSSGLSFSSGRREAYVKAKGAEREKQVRDVMNRSNERNKKEAEDNPNRAADNAHSDSGSPLIGGVRKQHNEKNKKQKHRSDASKPEEKRSERSVGTLVEKALAKGNHNQANNADELSMGTKPSAVPALDSDSRSLVPKYLMQCNEKNKKQKHGPGTSTYLNLIAESSSCSSSSSSRREGCVDAKGVRWEKQVRDEKGREALAVLGIEFVFSLKNCVEGSERRDLARSNRFFNVANNHGKEEEQFSRAKPRENLRVASVRDGIARGNESIVVGQEAQQKQEPLRSYQKADVAFSEGEKGYAACFSEGRKYSEMGRQEEEKPSQEIFSARYEDIKNVITIDLHDQHVTEAMRILKHHMLLSTINELEVITGHGLHSGGESRLKDSVIGLLVNEGIKCSEVNKGKLVFELGQSRNFNFLHPKLRKMMNLPIVGELNAGGDNYAHQRKTAQKLWSSMRTNYEKAAAARSEGKKGCAGYLSEKGCKLKREARREEKVASRNLFIAKNKDIKNVITIDLRGQNVEQAMRLVETHLLFPAIRELRLITDDVRKSELKESAIRLVEERGIKLSEGQGMVVIKFDICRNFDFVYASSESD